MNTYIKTFILLILVFYFSCDNDVTGNGDICTADPVGEWSGVTRTIAYVEECGSHCADYDLSYLDHYSYCSTELAGIAEFTCTNRAFPHFLNLDCYDILYVPQDAGFFDPFELHPDLIDDCDYSQTEEECIAINYCTWGGAGTAHCVSDCEQTEGNTPYEISCEWDNSASTCNPPSAIGEVDRLVNNLSCLDSDNIDPGSNCLWNGENLGEDNDSDGVLFEGNCGWGIELEVESNIESEFYTFDEDGNFSITGANEDIIGDYSCSEDNVELCEEENCEIWPFTQEDDQATIYIEDYSDEYTNYKEECTATGTTIIQKITN